MGIRRVIYIHHSGYYIELDTCQLLFDYCEGSLQMLKTEKPLIVFASHSHGDHFSPEIFRLSEKFSRKAPAARTWPGQSGSAYLQYVLSSDIPRRSVPAACKPLTRFIGPHEHISLQLPSSEEQHSQGHSMPDQLSHGQTVPDQRSQELSCVISTLRSNDQGVAFLIQAERVQIYFAGDLNDWYWDGDSEDLELERQYLSELEKIRGMHFDAAFIPVDPRLKDPCLGVIRFMEYADAARIFPMHMWDHYDVTRNLLQRPETVPYRDRIVSVTGDNAVFNGA